ncbi:MAG: hypothetical protein WDM81_13775 [Rhizomicrobium sp.]
MKIGMVLALLIVGTGTSGCATVFEGTSQDIAVVTNPPGAACVFERQSKTRKIVGTISSTPATVTVRKSKYDILVRCTKPGFQEATFLNHSGVTAVIAANIAIDVVATVGISSLVDTATGADNKYDSAVNLSLIPLGR